MKMCGSKCGEFSLFLLDCFFGNHPDYRYHSPLLWAAQVIKSIEYYHHYHHYHHYLRVVKPKRTMNTNNLPLSTSLDLQHQYTAAVNISIFDGHHEHLSGP